MIPRLILASTSPYRRALLAQLCLGFEQIAPAVDEPLISGEPPRSRAMRLAAEKSINVAAQLGPTRPAIIIGSDQVAHMGDRIFSKPGNFSTAVKQLKESSENWVCFSTAICLCDQDGKVLSQSIDHYEIKYRRLEALAIDAYLKKEAPYDCAGSMKAEALGITLIEQTKGKDINTLYGLPLILLVDLLREAGVDILNDIN